MSKDDSILTKQMPFLIDELNTPIGTMLLVVDLQGNLRAVDWKDHLSRMLRLLRIHYGDGGFALEASHDPAGMTDAMARYFEGDVSAIDRLQVQTRGTPFQREVWSALRTILCGTTTSYRQLAEQIGRSAAVRAVGTANGANPVSIVVPCHRVIGSNGSMTGYGGGIHRKLWLLEHERQHRRRTFQANPAQSSFHPGEYGYGECGRYRNFNLLIFNHQPTNQRFPMSFRERATADSGEVVP